MWKDFDGKPYTREELLAHVTALPPIHWARFITLHNTGSPTLEQWEAGGTTPAQRIKNLQHYYEVNEHWHAGPHLFIDCEHIWGFTDLTVSGVHASCFNGVAIGIEMVGDYSVETTVGAAEVIGWGGRFEAIPLVTGCSTTQLISRLRR